MSHMPPYRLNVPNLADIPPAPNPKKRRKNAQMPQIQHPPNVQDLLPPPLTGYGDTIVASNPFDDCPSTVNPISTMRSPAGPPMGMGGPSPNMHMPNNMAMYRGPMCPPNHMSMMHSPNHQMNSPMMMNGPGPRMAHMGGPGPGHGPPPGVHSGHMMSSPNGPGGPPMGQNMSMTGPPMHSPISSMGPMSGGRDPGGPSPMGSPMGHNGPMNGGGMSNMNNGPGMNGPGMGGPGMGGHGMGGPGMGGNGMGGPGMGGPGMGGPGMGGPGMGGPGMGGPGMGGPGMGSPGMGGPGMGGPGMGSPGMGGPGMGGPGGNHGPNGTQGMHMGPQVNGPPIGSYDQRPSGMNNNNFMLHAPNQIYHSKPMSVSAGKIYPADQPMVFNAQNPNAPPIYPCGVCHKEVHDNDQAILCESGCNFWFHRGCTGLTEAAFQLLTAEVYAEWVCDKCLQSKNIPLVKFKP